jgi:hypothetical protein
LIGDTKAHFRVENDWAMAEDADRQNEKKKMIIGAGRRPS